MAERLENAVIAITPEMIEAGCAAWRGLAKGDFDLMDRSEFVEMILRAGLNAQNLSGAAD